MSQHALVDGFFTFWALVVLWLLWENLRSGPSWLLIAGYVAALGLLVLTKENAFFVWVAIVALICANHWLQFGRVTRELLIATVVGPLLGVVLLVFLSGGVETLLASYRLSVGKNYHLAYAILTGDGPWYRYLVDLLLVSPVILILAFGAIFKLDRMQKAEWFVVIFIVASYMVMCSIKYGMNLRYANMWDMPLRVLALTQLISLTARLPRHRHLVLGVTVAALCVLELRQYWILCVQYPLYELVPEGLLRALHILKAPLLR
jgi:4-amino-4-deoxy-L-arabinose transferase-like glycosyltransferase